MHMVIKAIICFLVLFSTQNAFANVILPNNFNDWKPGKKQYTTIAHKPIGNVFEFRIPAGTTRAHIKFFVPLGHKAGSIIRIGQMPNCSYTTNMSTDEFIALPWDNNLTNNSIFVSLLKGRDCRLHNEGGMIPLTVIQRSYNPLESAERLFAKFLKYDSKSYVYEAHLIVEVDSTLYEDWYRRGQPLPSTVSASGPCDPIWNQGSGPSPPPTPPSPIDECNLLMEWVCKQQGLKCVDNTCVSEDVPEVIVNVNVGQEKILNLTDPDVVIKKVNLHGVPNGVGSIIAAYADMKKGEVYIASQDLNGDVIFEKFCQGDPITPYSKTKAINNTISSNAFAHLGTLNTDAVYAIFFMSAIINGKLYYGTFQQGDTK